MAQNTAKRTVEVFMMSVGSSERRNGKRKSY